MNAMYDVICSTVIAGVVLAMLVGFNGNIAESAATQTVKMLAQSNLTKTAEILEYDFSKIGYGMRAYPADSAIVYATPTAIVLRGDFNNDGAVDYLKYAWDSTESSSLPNTKTHVLHRIFNGIDIPMNVGVTRVRFRYYYPHPLIPSIDTTFNTISESRPWLIHTIRVSLTVESTVPYKGSTEGYLKFNPGVCWERTFHPRNLMR